ncbi:MAG: pyridoxal phosphate-dependent aminotransferase [Deltaproteobacteria bacterium]|nr:pyridoxal phosphate-dependent aminotransferase [Deltaproteobacteria bacterium]
MASRLASRLSVVVPSATLAINARAQELRAQGVDVISFGAGEPDFDTPTAIRAAGIRAIEDGRTRYTPVSGIPELRAAIAEQSTRDRAVPATAAMVTVSVGAKGALFNLALALYEPGDEVLIPAPYWVSYPEQVRLLGATPVFLPSTLDAGWKCSPEELARALTPRTKAVLLCSPSNPTGAAYTRAELNALAQVLRPHDCWILADEIYGRLVYDGFEQVSLLTVAPDLLARLVVIDGASKSYAMTGWRVGWSIAPAPLARALDTVQGQGPTSAATMAQYATLEALRIDDAELAPMRALFQARRDRLVAGLRALPGVRCALPEGAFYAFPEIRGWLGRSTPSGLTLSDDLQVTRWLLDEAHVAVVPGSAFGAPGHLRLSYAVGSAAIDEALARLGRAVATLV